ncbi:MAG: hypothetical protein QOI38_2558 [Sphingomonadales bacterium]|jgi:hypothetical protein|nr:hypothetical protein [Sphingomonadales bacterium]
MRFLLPSLVCLALAACGPDAQPGGNRAPPPGNAAAAVAAPGAELMPRVVAAMAALGIDPASSQFSNLRSGSAGAICGSVAVRGPDGTQAPPVPFLVPPEGAAMVSATAELGWDVPEDMFPPTYARWCATPRELEEMRAAIAAAPAPPPEEEPPLADEEPPSGEEPGPAPAPPPPRAAPPAARPPVPKWEPADPSDVSFTNQVRRPDR